MKLGAFRRGGASDIESLGQEDLHGYVDGSWAGLRIKIASGLRPRSIRRILKDPSAKSEGS